MEVKAHNMESACAIGHLSATDLADYLVKSHSIPFRKAYQVTAMIVNFAEKKKKKLFNWTMSR